MPLSIRIGLVRTVLEVMRLFGHTLRKGFWRVVRGSGTFDVL